MLAFVLSALNVISKLHMKMFSIYSMSCLLLTKSIGHHFGSIWMTSQQGQVYIVILLHMQIKGQMTVTKKLADVHFTTM